MDTLSALDPLAWLPEYLPLHPAYRAGNALGWLSLENKQASTNYPLAGRLYVSKSGWLMLSVPNALVRGVYDALVAPGAELPGQERSDVLNAHISVMTAAEVSKLSPNTINERGHNFHYTLGALREITVNKAGNLSRVWAIQISSPQLSAIRKSYGLSPLLKDEPFHITVACRRKGVLLNNGTSKGTAEAVQEISRGKLKAASADETTYDCGCSGSCVCPDTCVCKKTGCARKKTAAVQNFVTAQGFDRLGAEPPAYQNQWLGERYRLAPDAAGNLVGAVPGLAKKQLFHGAPIYGYQTVPGWKDTKAAADITKLSPKWSNREHLLAALPKHLTDTQTAMSTPGGNVDKEMIDLGLIARAWLKSQQQKELLAARFKKFQETSAYPSLALQTPSLTMATKGARHEYTNNDQVTKEIAPDHLPEEPAGYKKVREIEKPARPRIIEELLAAKNHSDNKRYGHKSQILRKLMEQSPQDWVIDDSAPKFQGITHTPTKFRFHTDRTAIPTGVKAANTGSVYGNQLTNMMSLRQPIRYDHAKPVFENVTDNLSDVKRRGDFMLQAKRNNQQYRAAIDPKYRYQLAMQAFNGQMDQPAVVDQMIEQHGDRLLNMTGVPH